MAERLIYQILQSSLRAPSGFSALVHCLPVSSKDEKDLRTKLGVKGSGWLARQACCHQDSLLGFSQQVLGGQAWAGSWPSAHSGMPGSDSQGWGPSMPPGRSALHQPLLPLNLSPVCTRLGACDEHSFAVWHAY